MKSTKTIIIDSKIEVVIVSSGGVGTTFFIDEVAKYIHCNNKENKDGIKHLFIPPISRNRNLKVVYIFGSPKLACISLFRRKYHTALSTQIKKHIRSNKITPLTQSLTEYLEVNQDSFHFEQHLNNWSTKFRFHDTLFLRYETIQENLQVVSRFLNLPKQFKENFPPKKERISSVKKLKEKDQISLNFIYGSYEQRQNKMPDYFIKSGSQPSIVYLFIFSKLYRKAFTRLFFKKYPLIRKIRNKITTTIESNGKKDI